MMNEMMMMMMVMVMMMVVASRCLCCRTEKLTGYGVLCKSAILRDK